MKYHCLNLCRCLHQLLATRGQHCAIKWAAISFFLKVFPLNEEGRKKWVCMCHLLWKWWFYFSLWWLFKNIFRPNTSMQYYNTTVVCCRSVSVCLAGHDLDPLDPSQSRVKANSVNWCKIFLFQSHKKINCFYHLSKIKHKEISKTSN